MLDRRWRDARFALVVLLLVPLVGSLVVFCLPKRETKLVKQVTLAVTLIVVVYAIVLGVHVRHRCWRRAVPVPGQLDLDQGVRRDISRSASTASRWCWSRWR